MKQLTDIQLKRTAKGTHEKYAISIHIKNTDNEDNNTLLAINGNDIGQLIWWSEWKISHELTDGEVSMDVQ